MQHRLRRHTDAQLERQRWRAEQAPRERADWQQAAWENALERAGELVLAGDRVRAARVLEVAMKGAAE